MIFHFLQQKIEIGFVLFYKGVHPIHKSRLMKELMKPFRDREFSKGTEGFTDVVSLYSGVGRRKNKYSSPAVLLV